MSSSEKRIQALFQELVALGPEDRRRRLESACGDDRELRDHVERLLAIDEQAKDHRILEVGDTARTLTIEGESSIDVPLAPGTRLGSYEIVARLGAGGMGEVYRALDHKLKRDVAVKLLRQKFISDPERLARFVQEARAASSLNHPNVITIHDIGKQDARLYIVMEFIQGRTLHRILSEEDLAAGVVLDLGRQVAEGLAKAHEAGLVHRDLKPENLMVTDEGLAKILDFGLVKLLSAEVGNADATPMTRPVTDAGVVLGTPSYMSPEQAVGGPVDFHSDQFSLGSILYEMATGISPFRRGSRRETIAAILNDEPDAIQQTDPSIPPAFSGVVQRCLAKDPRQRYASTRELAQELRTLQQQAPASEGTASALRSWYARANRFVVSVSALALLGLVGWSFWFFGGEPRLPAADSRRYAVALTHMENDAGGQYEQLLVESLNEQFASSGGNTVQVLRFDRTIRREGPDLEESVLKGHAKAQEYLAESGAEVLIWGAVLTFPPPQGPQLKLYWTPSRETQLATDWGRRYDTASELQIPSILWEDLAAVLQLLVVAQQSELEKLEGDFLAERLRPFIRKVRLLLNDSALTGWTQENRHGVQLALAKSLLVLGQETGQSTALEEAALLFRELIAETEPGASPWGDAQVGLGRALFGLGSRNLDRMRLEGAVSAFREALSVYDRETRPIEWARVQIGLGNAMASLGAWQSDGDLEEAVKAYRRALEVLTRENSPINWAKTQNNLGNALWFACERSAGTDCLEEVRAAFAGALEVFRREREPLYWAMSASNLGNALYVLGDRQPMPQARESLEQALAAYREAIFVYRREEVPEDWAMSQANLCGTLAILGKRTADLDRLEEARNACELALAEAKSRDNAGLLAAAHENLGNALTALGELRDDTKVVEQGIASYQVALSQHDKDRSPLRWAALQTATGNALRFLGSSGDGNRLCEALGTHLAAWEISNEIGAPAYSEQAREGVQADLSALSQSDYSDESERCAAQHSRALDHFREISMDGVSKEVQNR